VWLLFGAILILFLGSRFLISEHDGEMEFTRSQRDLSWVSIGKATYLLRDIDEDGQVDCLRNTGVGGVGIVSATWSAEGYKCRKIGKKATMSSEMREIASRILLLNFENDLGHHTPVDQDGDGQVDCTVNVHNPEIVLTQARSGACADAEDATVVVPEIVPVLNELLGLRLRLEELAREP
jgi:hypothetical protein